MKIMISLSATQITAKLLISKLTGTAHAGIQKFSTIGGRDFSWNFVEIINGRTSAVVKEEDAVGIACSNGKFYRL